MISYPSIQLHLPTFLYLYISGIGHQAFPINRDLCSYPTSTLHSMASNKVPVSSVKYQVSLQPGLSQGVNIPFFHNLIFLWVCPCKSLQLGYLQQSWNNQEPKNLVISSIPFHRIAVVLSAIFR